MSEEKKNEELKEDSKQAKEDKEEVVDAEFVDNEKEKVFSEDYLKLKDSFARLQADFANYKRRQEKEKLEIYKYASESLVTKLLNILDNFDRAMVDSNKEDSFVQGIEMIRKELNTVLVQEGLEEINADNEKFDANLHHAVFTEENDEVESDHIIETFQKGYKLKDKVIRPAMVKVSK